MRKQVYFLIISLATFFFGCNQEDIFSNAAKKIDEMNPFVESIEVTSNTTLNIIFIERVDKESAGIVDNFTIEGLRIISSEKDASNPTNIILTTSSQEDIEYELFISGVKDRFGNSTDSEYSSAFTGDALPYIVNICATSSTQLLVTYSEDMRASSGAVSGADSRDNYVISGGGIVADVSLAGAVASITTSLQTEGTHAISIINAQDLNGNPIDPARNRFDYFIDGSKPVITLLGVTPLSRQKNSEYFDDGATAFDDYEGDLTSKIVTVNNVDVTKIAVYQVIYNVNDFFGNSAIEVARTVKVIDTLPPTITLIGATPVTVEMGASYTDAGAIAYDLGDGDVSASITVTDSVDVNLQGTYTIAYDVSDSLSNAADQVVRTIYVVDTTLPNAPVVSVSESSPTTNKFPVWTWATGGGNGNGIFRYKLNDNDLTTGATVAAVFSYQPAESAAEGANTLYVQERDDAGNWSTFGSSTIVVDTISPGAPCVDIMPDIDITDNTQPIWTWSSGGNGNGKYRYKLDDTDLSTGSEMSGITYMPSFPLTDGTRTLYVQERDDAGNWSSIGCRSIIISSVLPADIIYVSMDRGSDIDTGLASNNSVATINEGIIKAAALGTPSYVKVEKGIYSIDDATQIILVNGVTVLGGYSTDFTDRDPLAYPSIITDTRIDVDFLTPDSPLSPVIATDGSINSDTVFDGFEINVAQITSGNGSPYVTGIFIDGASPTIQNNIINGSNIIHTDVSFAYIRIIGNASAIIRDNNMGGGSTDDSAGKGKTYGISVKDSSPNIDYNIINIGPGIAESNAVFIEITSGNASSPLIKNNEIIGPAGSTAISSGISVVNNGGIFGGKIENNTINAGMITGLADIHAYGIIIENADGSNNSLIINNNTVYGGKITGDAYYSYGIFFGLGVTVANPISNNTINGGNIIGNNGSIYGVYVSDAGIILKDNNIVGGKIEGHNGQIVCLALGENVNANIDSNKITGGMIKGDTGYLYGVYFNPNSDSEFVNNVIFTGNIEGNTSSAFGIFIDTATPAISNNEIDGGYISGASGKTYGICVKHDSSLLLESNIINGGRGTNFSCGVWLSFPGSAASVSNPDILKNRIHGGNGVDASFGIYCSNALQAKIYNNVIDGGRNFYSDTKGLYIHDNNSPFLCKVDVYNNTIYGGNTDKTGVSDASIAIAIDKSNNNPNLEINIKNNNIFAVDAISGSGIYEIALVSSVSSLYNNNFFNCVYCYNDSTSISIIDIAVINLLPDSMGNIAENIYSDLDSDYKFTGALDDVTFDTAGYDLSGEFTKDIENTTRIVPFSIGAYEH